MSFFADNTFEVSIGFFDMHWNDGTTDHVVSFRTLWVRHYSSRVFFSLS